MKILIKRNNLVIKSLPAKCTCLVCGSLLRIDSISEIKYSEALDFPMVECPACNKLAPLDNPTIFDKLRSLFS